MWIKNIIKAVLIFILLCLTNLSASDNKNNISDLAKLNHEIVLLNLINGLYLSDQQVESLILTIEEAQKVKQDFNEVLYQHKTELESILLNLKETLLQDKQISEILTNQILQMNKQQHELKDLQGEKLIELQENVKEILSPNQLILIEEFKPCTIPPKKGRIGQSLDMESERSVGLLERIREMPSYRYNRVKDRLVEIHMDKIEKFIKKFSESERQEYQQKILNTYDQARKLSDKEFLIQKNILAQKLIPESDTKVTLKKYQLDKVGKFFLDETLLNILKEKFGK